MGTYAQISSLPDHRLSRLRAATPAHAQSDAGASPVTVNGSATLTSDYRFRGVSQTDENMAVQGGLTLSHESGFYVGCVGGEPLRVGHVRRREHGTRSDRRLQGAAFGQRHNRCRIDLVHVSGRCRQKRFCRTLCQSSPARPAPRRSPRAPPMRRNSRRSAAGISPAPTRSAGVYNDRGDKEDNLYLWGDAAVAIAGTPITAKAHIGHSSGNDGLGPNATSVTPTGDYWDWSIGADATWKNLTLNVSYVDVPTFRRPMPPISSRASARARTVRDRSPTARSPSR